MITGVIFFQNCSTPLGRGKEGRFLLHYYKMKTLDPNEMKEK
jgi:hypothetical protein